MRIWLEGRGIAPERIVKEENSTSTLENLAFSKAIIEALGGDTAEGVAIVTSEYHLYRAKAFASELGLKPYGVAGKTGNIALRVNYFLREAGGVLHMRLLGFDRDEITRRADDLAREAGFA